jgi:hypothetical protein
MSKPIAQPDHDLTEQDVPGRQAKAAPVTVYTFIVWDHDRGANVIYPRMATLEAIRKMRGKVNEGTAWVVDASEVDADGLYPAIVR